MLNLPRMHPVVLNDDPPCHGVLAPAIVSTGLILSPLLFYWLWPQVPISELILFVLKLACPGLFSLGYYLSVRACSSWAEDKGYPPHYQWWGLLPLAGLLRVALLHPYPSGRGFPVQTRTSNVHKST